MAFKRIGPRNPIMSMPTTFFLTGTRRLPFFSFLICKKGRREEDSKWPRRSPFSQCTLPINWLRSPCPLQNREKTYDPFCSFCCNPVLRIGHLHLSICQKKRKGVEGRCADITTTCQMLEYLTLVYSHGVGGAWLWLLKPPLLLLPLRLVIVAVKESKSRCSSI